MKSHRPILLPARLVFSQAFLLLILLSPHLFKRGKPRVTRDNAFQELFTVVQTLFDSASTMKPDWNATWHARNADGLPEKYAFGNEIATTAAVDLRYATRLLRQNRWKSVVEPLFQEVDEQAWQAFQVTAERISYLLIDLTDRHDSRLLMDERDWINAAVEQLDDATMRRRENQRTNRPIPEQVAEGVYLPLYIAIQLSDRFIERLRHEAEQAK